MPPKIPQEFYDEPFQLSYDHAQATADTTVKLFKVPAGRKIRITGIDYVNPTGLAEHATAFFAVNLLKGATVMGTWSTDSAGAGDNSIPADTFIALTLSATDANRVAAGGDVLSLNLDRGAAAATLPAGRVVVRGRYIA